MAVPEEFGNVSRCEDRREPSGVGLLGVSVCKHTVSLMKMQSQGYQTPNAVSSEVTHEFLGVQPCCSGPSLSLSVSGPLLPQELNVSHTQHEKSVLHHLFKGQLMILQITRLIHKNIFLVKKTFAIRKMCQELIITTGCVLELSILFLLLCSVSDKSQFNDSMA